MTMTAGDIRQIFLRFFEEKNHLIVPSAPIVNKDDPTLMFVNAGMNPSRTTSSATGNPNARASPTRRNACA